MQPDELKQLRKAAGLTQGELANQVGLSQGYIGEMERGEKQIQPKIERVISEKIRLQQVMNRLVLERDDLLRQAEDLERDNGLFGANGRNVSADFVAIYRQHADRLQNAIEIGLGDYGLLLKSVRDDTGE